MSAPSDKELPPSMLAARRSGLGRWRDLITVRAYPSMALEDDAVAVAAQLGATRALLAVRRPDEVTRIVITLVLDLGGGVVPARLASATSSLPIDLSLGLEEPLLPQAEPVSVAALRLARILPDFVEDARQVVYRLQSDARLAHEAQRDMLTGLLTRRAWMRQLSQATDQDAVCLIDLDAFKGVNDSVGHAAGDAVLRAAGALLLGGFRSSDVCGRLGGDELVCLMRGSGADGLGATVDRLRQEWQIVRPRAAEGVGLSAGVADIGTHTPRAALHAADRALYRAKRLGRNRTEAALAVDYESPHQDR